MKILFLSDIHGSNLIFEKALNAISKFGIDIFIISGDLSGKDIRPIIKDGDRYITEIDSKTVSLTLTSAKEFEKHLADLGHYFFNTTYKEFEALKKDDSSIMHILNLKILSRLEFWILRIINQINTSKTQVIISPGNDDIQQIDDLLFSFESQGILTGIKSPVIIDNFDIITLDYSNITPWNTERELSEKMLGKLINEKIKKIRNVENCIFNFHCPPINTKLDLAPEIDKNLKYDIKPGGLNFIHTGSSAVYNSILKYQPLLSLHGHIHESKGFDYVGRTLSLNPGSEHDKGILNAYVVDISSQGTIENFFLIEE